MMTKTETEIPDRSMMSTYVTVVVLEVLVLLALWVFGRHFSSL
jgi:hypothetical protein